jgi:hypothetical protein
MTSIRTKEKYRTRGQRVDSTTIASIWHSITQDIHQAKK